MGVGGSERPAGAGGATDADSAPEPRSSVTEASSTKSSTFTTTGIAEEAGHRTVRMAVRVKIFPRYPELVLPKRQVKHGLSQLVELGKLLNWDRQRSVHCNALFQVNACGLY